MWPILFHIGGYPIHSYGVMLAVAVLVGLTVMEREAARRGLDPDHIFNLALILVVGGVVSSRLAYVIIEWHNYAPDPLSVFRIWDGGLSYYGALIAELPVVVLYSRLKAMRFGEVADIVALGLAVGYPFARIGCFLNGCCYGKPTDVPWAMVFTADGIARHPTQLYSVFIGALIFLTLWLMRGRKRFPGQLALLYLVLYGVYRFGIDFLRVSPPAGVYLTLGQAVSLLVAGGALVILLIRLGKLRDRS
ncbi:MAG: prolipoprotein diacylglyceryl transferase [Bacillota bacterium]